MRYLAVLALVDLMVLYQWNLNTFFKYNLSVPPDYKDLEEISVFWCRWISFFAFSCLQLSSWLLSLVSFDRFMIVYSQLWSKHMHEPSKINMIIGITMLTIFSINCHILFKNGYVETTPVSPDRSVSNSSVDVAFVLNSAASNESGSSLHKPASEQAQMVTNVVCYRTRTDKSYIFPTWQRAHLLIYNLVPFLVMLTCNSLIIFNIK